MLSGPPESLTFQIRWWASMYKASKRVPKLMLTSMWCTQPMMKTCWTCSGFSRLTLIGFPLRLRSLLSSNTAISVSSRTQTIWIAALESLFSATECRSVSQRPAPVMSSPSTGASGLNSSKSSQKTGTVDQMLTILIRLVSKSLQAKPQRKSESSTS